MLFRSHQRPRSRDRLELALSRQREPRTRRGAHAGRSAPEWGCAGPPRRGGSAFAHLVAILLILPPCSEASFSPRVMASSASSMLPTSDNQCPRSLMATCIRRWERVGRWSMIFGDNSGLTALSPPATASCSRCTSLQEFELSVSAGCRGASRFLYALYTAGLLLQSL